ncbi:hypothetical protein SVIOM342S_00844 [Streptomyces violaceorubidus]
MIAAFEAGPTDAGRLARAGVLGHAAAALSDRAAGLDLTDAQDTAVREVVVVAAGTQHAATTAPAGTSPCSAATSTPPRPRRRLPRRRRDPETALAPPTVAPGSRRPGPAAWP